MPQILEFGYRPLRELTPAELDYYMRVSSYPDIIDTVFLSPLVEKMEKSARDEFVFDDIKVTKSTTAGKPTTRWETVYRCLKGFLDIRADDSRAKDVEGLRKFEGIGYCIAVDDVIAEFNKYAKDATSVPESKTRIVWPKVKKGETYPREVSVPYERVNLGNLEVLKPALAAIRFWTGIKADVIKPYEDSNKQWLKEQTGCGADNLPSSEESPVVAARQLGKGSYVVISLTRVQDPDYGTIMSTLSVDLTAMRVSLDSGGFWRDYRRTDDKGVAYVNIKRLKDRLDTLFEGTKKEPHARYVINPK